MAVLRFRFAPPPVSHGAGGNLALTINADHSVGAGQNDGAPAVETISGQREVDLAQVISPLQETGTLQSLQGAVEYYNNNRAQMSFDERQAVVARITISVMGEGPALHHSRPI
jgi:hypothetical protein